MLILKVLVGLHRTIQLQLLQHYWLGHRLGYRDIKWFALETNGDHSVIFETPSKYCISGSFVDHDGYSISSKGFLPERSNPMSREQWLLRHRRAERSYPTRSGGVAVRRYLLTKVRSSGCTLLEQP